MNCPNLCGDDGFDMTLNPALDFGDFGIWSPSPRPSKEASQALASALPVALNGQDSEAEEALSTDDGVLATLAGFFSGASHAISEFKLNDAAIGTSMVDIIEGHDLVFNVVKAARTIMNVCENAVVDYLSLKLFSHSFSFFAKKSVTGVAISAVEGVVNFVGNITLTIAAPIWLVSWFYAYLLPMLPFLAWFAACPLWLVADAMPEATASRAPRQGPATRFS